MAKQLKKQDQNGKRYERPPNIEKMIDEALTQDLSMMQQRLTLNRRSSGYLPSECLVHLIRDAKRRTDSQTMNMLLSILLPRCEANLRGKIPDDKFANASYLREEVLCQFAVLFAEDGFDETKEEELDYFECRFNSAFRTFRIDIIRHEINNMKRVDSLSSFSDHEEVTILDEKLPLVSEAFRAETPESGLFNKEILEAIDNLPPDERKAIILCHIMGYKEESEDPNKITAATLCGVTGRTIRNRLTRAAAKLLKFKEAN